MQLMLFVREIFQTIKKKKKNLSFSIQNFQTWSPALTCNESNVAGIKLGIKCILVTLTLTVSYKYPFTSPLIYTVHLVLAKILLLTNFFLLCLKRVIYLLENN